MVVSRPPPPPTFLFDAPYCSEQQREEETDDEEETEEPRCYYSGDPPLTLLEQDLCWDDEEVLSLSSKESPNPLKDTLKADSALGGARADVVDWILEATACHGFSAPAAVLALNYLDRFLCTFRLDAEKSWMSQLVVVACLSVAAKVEESQVPLLLDLQAQVEETRFVFEAKTIQRMELLVLSALEWKMSPVTPTSFLDHFARRLRLKGIPSWEFLRRSELIILSFISGGSLFINLR